MCSQTGAQIRTITILENSQSLTLILTCKGEEMWNSQVA